MPWTTRSGHEPVVHRTVFYERKKFEGRLLWTFQVPFNLVRMAGDTTLSGGSTFLEPKSILSEKVRDSADHRDAPGITCMVNLHGEQIDELAPYDSVILHSRAGNGRPEDQLHKFSWWPVA